MKIRNFIHILIVVLALSAYSAWVASARKQEAAVKLPGDTPASTFPLLQVPLLKLSEAEALWHQESTLFLDVRSAGDYQLGHIAGAIDLPDEEFDQQFPACRARLEHAAAIVIYCKSSDCAKSYWCAIRLHNLGLTRIHIYPEGWNEWSLHELPSARS